MIFVLIILCIVFSAVTYKRQSAEGAGAGAEAARRVINQLGSDIQVAIYPRDNQEDKDLAEAAKQTLIDAGAKVLDQVSSEETFEVRASVEKYAASEQPLQAIIVSRSVSQTATLDALTA